MPVGGRGPLSDSEATAFDYSEWVISDFHRFLVSISGAKKFVMNLELFVVDKVALVDAPNTKRLAKAVANLYVSSSAGVDDIVAERNASNESNEALPPVVPLQLAVLSHSEF